MGVKKQLSNEYIPYTYLIGWSELNQWYYGRRTAKNCHPSDLWTKYFTSSKYVKELVKIYGRPDIIQIRRTFPGDSKKCCKWESRVLEKMNVQNNPLWVNKKNGDKNWDTTGISHQRSDKSKQKYKQTLIEKYGVDNPSLAETVKQKRKETFQTRYGVSNSFHKQDFLAKAKETWIKKYGVDNPNKRQITCEYCGKTALIAHVKQCHHNPNKSYSGLPGIKNHKAKLFIVQDPDGKIYEIAGWFTEFCKRNRLSSRLLRENKKTKGWTLLSSAKIN